MGRSRVPTVRAEWPFVGRDDEISAVRAAFVRGAAVVIAGAAGHGKSRLAREFVADLAPAVAPAVVNASASSREIPLGAFAPWLSSLSSSDDEPDTQAVTTALARAGAAVRARGPEAVLLVDDAHMLDAVSATLVHQLAQEGAVRLVLTVRSGEPCPDAVTSIWKDRLAERIDLPPLDAEASAELLTAVLGAPVDASALRRLHDTTRGNVLWLRHLVEDERAAGRLTLVDDHWKWQGTPKLSPALEELLLERIGALAEGERHLLELVALGEPLGLSMLGDLVSAHDIEHVADRGLVVVSTDGARSEVRLAHPLYGETMRARLSVPRARRLRGELSRALGATGARRASDELRRAVLDLDSDSTPSSELLMLAAEQAIDLTDYNLAERLLRAAIAAGGGFDARLALGFLVGWLMRLEESEHELAAAVAEAVAEPQQARAVLARTYVVSFLLGRPEEGRRILDREGVDGDGTPFPETEAFRAVIDVGAGDVVSGVATALAVLDRDGSSSQALTWACWAAAWGSMLAGGRAAQVRDLVVRGMDAARRAPETVAMLGNIAFGEIATASYSGALATARPRLEWVDGLPGAYSGTWSALYRGRLALDAGQPRTAVRLLESVLPTFPGQGGGWTSWLQAMISQAHAALGDAAAAEAALGTAEEARHPMVHVSDGDIGLARAWVLASRGSTSEAVAVARRVAADARRRGQYAVEVVLRHAAVRFGDRYQRDALAELAVTLDSPRARVAAAHAVALDGRDVDTLLAAADDAEACGLLLAAADAAAHAAAVAREQGRLASATEAADRAAALAADRCEGAVTPALAQAHAPLPISDRQREIATLAADGLTNRAIAERLHVSVRTVESHIYHACNRLGLPDRAALAAVVVPRRRDAPPFDGRRR